MAAQPWGRRSAALWGVLSLAWGSTVWQGHPNSVLHLARCWQPIRLIPAKGCTGVGLQLVMLGFGLSTAQRSLDWLQTPALLSGESCLPPEDFALNKSLLHSNPMFLLA